MRFIGFEITNFKGIEKTVMHLSKVPNANIFTLVGLNESGKTTILEAINSFSPEREGIEALYRDVFKAVRTQDLVPKDKKKNFSGAISVRALLSIDNEDKKRIEKFCLSHLKCEIDLDKITNVIEVGQEHTFKGSTFQDTNVDWDVDIFLRKRKQGKFKEYHSDSQEWQAVVDFIGNLIPKVCYFPTFLFNFPEKIYLSNPPKKFVVNAYYVQIVQDILDSMGENLNIEEHIIQRVERTVDANASWDWFWFLRTDEKQQVDHVMLEVGVKVTDVVIARWNEIFGLRLQNRAIEIEWGVENALDDSSKRAVYMKFWIRDGRTKFELAERSLGFRWFFSFFLFTQFRVSRRDSAAVFLFDEPASNLHSKAQEQLLRSFSEISKGNNMIIYSTHSHYMIEPRWLEGAFIVFNDAIDYDDPGSDSHRASATRIHVKKYREFVSQNSSKLTYFQPILDKLDYAPGKLEFGAESVFVEGKNDFYMLGYFKDIIFEGKKDLSILPSSGANDLGPLISLYLGWAKKFIVLLDDDKAGRAACDRYRLEWLLSEKTVITLADVLPGLANKAIERVLSPAAHTLIATELGKDTASKKDIGRFFQEKYAQGKVVKFDAETLKLVRTLLDSCVAKLK